MTSQGMRPGETPFQGPTCHRSSRKACTAARLAERVQDIPEMATLVHVQTKLGSLMWGTIVRVPYRKVLRRSFNKWRLERQVEELEWYFDGHILGGHVRQDKAHVGW